MLIAYSSPYQLLNPGCGPHKESDWEVYTDQNMNNRVFESYHNQLDLTDITFEVPDPTDIYIRVRYRSDICTSDWSPLYHYTEYVPPSTPTVMPYPGTRQTQGMVNQNDEIVLTSNALAIHANKWATNLRLTPSNGSIGKLVDRSFVNAGGLYTGNTFVQSDGTANAINDSGVILYLYTQPDFNIPVDYLSGIFNPTTNSWTPTQNPPKVDHATIQVIDNNTFIVFTEMDIDSGVRGNVYTVDVNTGLWTLIGTMPNPPFGHSSSKLPDGDFLVCYVKYLNWGEMAESYTYRYNYATDTWTLITPLPQLVWRQAQLTDTNGDVYIFGGFTSAPVQFDEGPEVDPWNNYISSIVYKLPYNSNTWEARSNLPLAVANSSAVELSNGEKYIAGGDTTYIKTKAWHMVLFDPSTGDVEYFYSNKTFKGPHRITKINNTLVTIISIWGNPYIYEIDLATKDVISKTQMSGNYSYGYALDALPNGEWIKTGGTSSNYNMSLSTDEVITSTGPKALMPEKLSNHASTVLNDGRLMVSGGYRYSSSWGVADISQSAMIYDISLDTWTVVSDLPMPLQGHSMSTLQDGRVLISGGNYITKTTEYMSDYLCEPSSKCWFYDPITDQYTDGPTLPYGITSHDQVTLPDGKVMITGGVIHSNVTSSPYTFIYDPANPSNGWVPSHTLPFSIGRHNSVVMDDGRILFSSIDDMQNYINTNVIGYVEDDPYIYHGVSIPYITPSNQLYLLMAGCVKDNKLYLVYDRYGQPPDVGVINIVDITTGTRSLSNENLTIDISYMVPLLTNEILLVADWPNVLYMYDITNDTITFHDNVPVNPNDPNQTLGVNEHLTLSDGRVIFALRGQSNPPDIDFGLYLYEPASKNWSLISNSLTNVNIANFAMTELQDGRVFFIGSLEINDGTGNSKETIGYIDISNGTVTYDYFNIPRVSQITRLVTLSSGNVGMVSFLPLNGDNAFTPGFTYTTYPPTIYEFDLQTSSWSYLGILDSYIEELKSWDVIGPDKVMLLYQGNTRILDFTRVFNYKDMDLYNLPPTVYDDIPYQVPPNLPEAIRDTRICSLANGDIINIVNYSENMNYSSNIYNLSKTTNMWDLIGTMPNVNGVAGDAMVLTTNPIVASNGLVYTLGVAKDNVGSYGNSVPTYFSYSYDINTDTWTMIADFPFVIDGHSQAYDNVANIILIGGGFDIGSNVPMDNIYSYDPVSDQYSPYTNQIPTPVGNAGMCMLPNGKVVLLGGKQTINGAPVALLQVWDQSTGTWLPSITTTDTYESVKCYPVSINQILIVGGMVNSALNDVVLVMNIDTGTVYTYNQYGKVTIEPSTGWLTNGKIGFQFNTDLDGFTNPRFGIYDIPTNTWIRGSH